MIEQLPDYITKCDVPGSQGKHYRDNNNCTDGCLALVKHATNGQKDYQDKTLKPKARRLHYETYDYQIIYCHWHWLGISIYISYSYSVLCESQRLFVD